MEGKARDLDVREPRYLSAEGIQQVITPQDEDFQLVSLLLAPLPGDTLQESVKALEQLETCSRKTRLTPFHRDRSEEHTYELQSLMRNSYAVVRLKKKNPTT